MQSTNDNSPRVVLSFPSAATASDASATQEDYAEIHELCRDTNLALQELHHGIANIFRDTLEKMDLDVWTLVQILDERPSVVRDLLDGEFYNLATATMIEYLEKLRP
jgi:hypothetical protein